MPSIYTFRLPLPPVDDDNLSRLFGNLCLKEKKRKKAERKEKEKKNIMKRKERGKQGRRLNSLGIQRVGSIVGGKAGFMEKESLKRGINSTKKDSRNRILDLLDLEVKKLEMRNRRRTR